MKKRKRGSSGLPSIPQRSQSAEVMASESFSPTGLVGTNTLEGGGDQASAEVGAVQTTEPEEVVQIDFSQMDEESRQANPQQMETEIKQTIESLTREQARCRHVLLCDSWLWRYVASDYASAPDAFASLIKLYLPSH